MRFTKCSILYPQLKYIQGLESLIFLIPLKKVKKNVNVKSMSKLSKAGQSVLKYWITSSVLMFQKKNQGYLNTTRVIFSIEIFSWILFMKHFKNKQVQIHKRLHRETDKEKNMANIMGSNEQIGSLKLNHHH